ncbi:MAG: hypothetical protein V1735_02835 [Nanoarchaeota archaeon]
MGKLKAIFTNFRVIILLVVMLLALVAINPAIETKGLLIGGVAMNSSASIAGIQVPNPATAPRSRERVLAINNRPVNTVEEYRAFVTTLEPERSFTIKTTKTLYRLTTKPLLRRTALNETELRTVTEYREENVTTENGTVESRLIPYNVTKEMPKILEEVIGTEDIGLRLYLAPDSNLRKGLDLQGGSRVLMAPEEKVTQDQMDTIIENLKQRLNVFGLSDVVVRQSGDLSGNQYISVEIAGANEEEVKELLGRQGKFESRIKNQTVFRGGEDITYVCRSAECSGIDPQVGCGRAADGATWVCRFQFAITLTPEAARRQADLTRDLEIVSQDGTKYLSEKIDLFLDDQLVDSLNIGADLKGVPTTDIAISGSGVGTTEQEAVTNSLQEMKRLQTILITGSLPVKIGIVKADNISPALGSEFMQNALLIGVLAALAVALIIFFRYRKVAISVGIIFTMFAETWIVLGLAALIGWNLDLAAIAGIIVALGTGVNDQIVITDEIIQGEKASSFISWKQRIKQAFFIIFSAYFATVVAMLPLWFAGAGLLKGFAVTTILAVTIGVLITRPAFAAVVERLLKK